VALLLFYIFSHNICQFLYETVILCEFDFLLLFLAENPNLWLWT